MKRIVAVLAAALAPALALAQSFPSHSVKIMVPYSAGIGPDLFVRALGEVLEKQWHQPVVIENKPGGNGIVAVEAFKQSRPNGYDLLALANSHLTINPNLLKNVPYDPLKDFVPIIGLFQTYFFVAVKADGPYTTIPRLIAGAKAHPGELSYGSPYVGSPTHLGAAVFEHETGTRMIHVPFKDQLQIYTEIANGTLTWTIATASSSRGMVKAGRLKLIAVAAPHRLKDHPDVPTVEEAGGPKNFVVSSWIVLLAPRGTPAALAATIHDELGKAIESPEMQKRYAALGFEPMPLGPDEIRALIRTDLAKNAQVIRQVGAKPE